MISVKASLSETPGCSVPHSQSGASAVQSSQTPSDGDAIEIAEKMLGGQAIDDREMSAKAQKPAMG
jgi:hypothetical protein